MILILTLSFMVAANTDQGIQLCPDNATDKWAVEEITLLPNADLTANGSNYTSLRAYKAATAITAARSTASTGFTAGTPEKQALTGTGTDLEISQASPLKITSTKTGTGVAQNFTVLVRVRVVRV